MSERVAGQYFKGVERLLASRYGLIGSSHPSDKGESREALLVEVLNNHLPHTARAYRGGQVLFVTDQRSAQTDVVIYSAYAPRLAQHEKPMFLAEGVYVAVEVRSVLNLDMLPAFVRWSHQIKSAPRAVRLRDGSVIEKPAPIATGLFAYTTKARSMETLAQRLAKACTAPKILPEDRPDFICINGEMTLFVVSEYEDLNEFQIEPDFVAKRSSAIGRVIGYRESFATLIASMAAHVQPDKDIDLSLTRYLASRPTAHRGGDAPNRR
jgi:hypothetical protein